MEIKNSDIDFVNKVLENLEAITNKEDIEKALKIVRETQVLDALSKTPGWSVANLNNESIIKTLIEKLEKLKEN